MSTYWSMSCYDLKRNDFVLSTFAGERLIYRPMYQDLACLQCKKINEFEALRRGFDPALRLPKHEIYFSLDDFLILGSRIKQLLEDLAPAEVDFHPLANQ